MKSILRVCSIICFVMAIPSMIVINWYFYDYGLLSMFTLICFGLMFDQLIRIFYPTFVVNDDSLYRNNKITKLIALLLFVISPMIFVYGNRIQESYGTISFFIMIGVGLLVDMLAKTLFKYSRQ